MADDYNKDYWAPDRAQVLQSMGIQDTSGKVLQNGQWVNADQATQPSASQAQAGNPAGQAGGAGAYSAPTGGSPPFIAQGGATQITNPSAQLPPWTNQPAPAFDMSAYMPGGASFDPRAPAGFDQTKWSDPTKMDPKYEVGRILAGGGTPQQAAQAIGGTYMGKDLIKMADGTVVDIYKDYGGPGQAVQFNPWDMTPGGSATGATGGSIPSDVQTMFQSLGIPSSQWGSMYQTIASSPYTYGGNGAIGGGAGLSGNVGTAGLPTSGWSPDPRTNDLYNLLQGRAGQSLNIDPNDPIIKNQVNAYTANATRAYRNNINELAEQGGPNANLGAQERQGAEAVAQGAGGMQAQLMQSELTARRQEIQDALTQMGGMLSDEQKMQLQNQLAIMDNLLAQAGLSQGAYQFDQQLALNQSPLSL